MQEALTLEKLHKNVRGRYEKDEERIVGIMLARYELGLTQRIVEECYTYWDRSTSKYLDIFWAGYGAYMPEHMESPTKTILKFKGNTDHAYFDLEAFVTIKKEFEDIFEDSYRDRLQLILLNYRDGRLHFDESMLIDLEENLDQNYLKIRDIMSFITKECRHVTNVSDLSRNMKLEEAKTAIKGITLSDVVKIGLKILTK